jgi:uncharacterized protein YjdB
MAQNPVFETFDEDAIVTREGLIRALQAGKVRVAFTTADGSPRDMECTLNESLIPTEQRPVKAPITTLQDIAYAPDPRTIAEATKVQDPNLIKVYALDRQGWRSFRFERLLSHSNP